MTPEEQARRGNFERLTVMVTVEANGQARVRITHKDRSTDYRDARTLHEERFHGTEADRRLVLSRMLDIAQQGCADLEWGLTTEMVRFTR